MSQINSKIKDDFQVVLLLSCFVGHPVYKIYAVCQSVGWVKQSFGPIAVAFKTDLRVVAARTF